MIKKATAFLAERVVIDKGVKGNRRKQLSGKTLRYDRCTPEYKRGLDESRKAEWEQWIDFGTTLEIQGGTLHELLEEGFSPILTQ